MMAYWCFDFFLLGKISSAITTIGAPTNTSTLQKIREAQRRRPSSPGYIHRPPDENTIKVSSATS